MLEEMIGDYEILRARGHRAQRLTIVDDVRLLERLFSKFGVVRPQLRQRHAIHVFDSAVRRRREPTLQGADFEARADQKLRRQVTTCVNLDRRESDREREQFGGRIAANAVNLTQPNAVRAAKDWIEANAAGESAREQVRVAKMTDDVRAMLALAVDVCHNARLQAHHFQRDRRRRQSRGVNERPSRYGHLISREKGEWSGAVRLVEMNDGTSICRLNFAEGSCRHSLVLANCSIRRQRPCPSSRIISSSTHSRAGWHQHPPRGAGRARRAQSCQ